MAKTNRTVTFNRDRLEAFTKRMQLKGVPVYYHWDKALQRHVVKFGEGENHFKQAKECARFVEGIAAGVLATRHLLEDDGRYTVQDNKALTLALQTQCLDVRYYLREDGIHVVELDRVPKFFSNSAKANMYLCGIGRMWTVSSNRLGVSANNFTF